MSGPNVWLTRRIRVITVVGRSMPTGAFLIRCSVQALIGGFVLPIDRSTYQTRKDFPLCLTPKTSENRS